MNTILVLAGSLAFGLGVVHSVMGEVLIFRRLATDRALLNQVGLSRRHVNIIWASWHLVTVFGWGIAAVLFCLAYPVQPAGIVGLIGTAIAVATLAASGLVLVGTRGKHPGWIVLLAIALLTWFSGLPTR